MLAAGAARAGERHHGPGRNHCDKATALPNDRIPF